jgi:hypothetical protein
MEKILHQWALWDKTGMNCFELIGSPRLSKEGEKLYSPNNPDAPHLTTYSCDIWEFAERHCRDHVVIITTDNYTLPFWNALLWFLAHGTASHFPLSSTPDLRKPEASPFAREMCSISKSGRQLREFPRLREAISTLQ